MLVEVVDRLNLISGKLEGDITKEVAKRYFQEVGKVADQKGLNRVITDLREANLKADERDMRDLSKELAQLGLACTFRRAMVVKNDVNDYKLWENHCLSAGHKDLRLFSDKDAALEWLAE